MQLERGSQVRQGASLERNARVDFLSAVPTRIPEREPAGETRICRRTVGNQAVGDIRVTVFDRHLRAAASQRTFQARRP